MRLSDLALACYIYARMTDYDSSYYRFLEETAPLLDLRLAQHQAPLLKWLNDWGCRQFAKEYHSLAAEEICEWYEEIGPWLFPPSTNLLSLTVEDFDRAEIAYSKLVGRTACRRTLANGQISRVEIGRRAPQKYFSPCVPMP